MVPASPRVTIDPLCTALRGVLYGDFLRPGVDNQRYEEVTEPAQLLKAVEDALAHYNAQVGVDGRVEEMNPSMVGC